MPKFIKRIAVRVGGKNSMAGLKMPNTRDATKKSKYNVKTRITSALRKLWQWSPNRHDAVKRARVCRGLYRCAKCSETVSSQFFRVDHKTSCVPPSGWDSWDGFITRLFCEPDGLQVLCQRCHEQKSCQEREAKKQSRKQEKAKNASSLPRKLRKVG